jgi:hypothetical protein
MNNYDRELNRGMKVFSKLYVGLKEQGNGKPDLGFATPFENNAAFRKRKETVDRWVGHYQLKLDAAGTAYEYDEHGDLIRIKTEPRHKIVDNKPRSGFRITDDIKRVYWGGGNVVWRVYDPEGFELEIQSRNLMAIIQTAGLNEGGVIPGCCLWGRDGKDNILLHEKSEEYKNAIKAAETLKPIKHVETSKRIIGTKYLMQGGREGIFLGKFWIIRDDYADSAFGDRFDAKVGILAVSGNVTKRVMKEPEAFDAVMFGDNDFYIKLYKKAPLIRPVEEPKSITQEAAYSRLKNASSVSFVSSSMSGRIAFIHYKKFAGYKYEINKMRDSIFNDQLKMITDSSDYYFVNGKTKQTYSAGSLHAFFGTYGSEASIIALKRGEKFYSSFKELAIPYYHARDITAYHTMWPLDVQDKMISEFHVESYSINESYRRPDKILNDRHHVSSITIPSFTDRKLIANWFRGQYEQGNLFEVQVQPLQE